MKRLVAIALLAATSAFAQQQAPTPEQQFAGSVVASYQRQLAEASAKIARLEATLEDAGRQLEAAKKAAELKPEAKK